MPTFYFYELQQSNDECTSQFFIYMDKITPQSNTIYMGKLEVDSDDVSVAFAEFIKSLGRTPAAYSTKSIGLNPEAWIAEFQEI